MNPTRNLAVMAAALSLAASAALAGSPERVGTGGALELRLPVGARSIALSESDLGSVGGAEALYYNPAGIVDTDSRTEVTFTHTDYIADTQINYVAVTQATGPFGSLGLSAKVFSVGDIPYTTETAPDGTGEVFSPTFSSLGFTYARKMTDRVNFGATVSYNAERIMQETAAGVSFNFGFQYDTDFRGLKLGLAMRNVGPNMEFRGSDFERLQRLNSDDPQAASRSLGLSAAEFELPTTFQYGLSCPVALGPENSLMIHGLYMSNSFAVDEGRVGAEYAYRKIATLRAGYKITTNDEDLFGFSYGLGVRLAVGGSNLWVDYAGQTVNDFFDDVQHVTATFKF